VFLAPTIQTQNAKFIENLSIGRKYIREGNEGWEHIDRTHIQHVSFL
jgi:hypothetical protein